MSVWADDEEIVCIHPTGQRLTGAEAIRDSWRSIFANNPRLMVRLSRGVRWNGMLLSVHNVVETLYIGDERKPHGPMLATNVFQRGASGWRLLAHHSSTAADRDAADSERQPASATGRGRCIDQLPRARLAARRPRPDHLPAADPARSPALSPRALGNAGRRLHRPRLDRRPRPRDSQPGCAAAADPFHGLEGSSSSHYAITLMGAAAAIGWSGVVVNFRGCSGESNRLPRAYHSGDSDEIDWILRRLRAAFPTRRATPSASRSVAMRCSSGWANENGWPATCLQAAPRSAPRSTSPPAVTISRAASTASTPGTSCTPEAQRRRKLRRYPGLFDERRMLRPATCTSSTMSSRHRCMVSPAPTTTGDERRASPGWPASGCRRCCSTPQRSFPAAQALPAASQVAASVHSNFRARAATSAFVTGSLPGQLDWLPQRIFIISSTRFEMNAPLPATKSSRPTTFAASSARR
jgi:ketosteroid isomerase-like protein